MAPTAPSSSVCSVSRGGRRSRPPNDHVALQLVRKLGDEPPDGHEVGGVAGVLAESIPNQHERVDDADADELESDLLPQAP